MHNISQILKDLAKENHIKLEILEKDYALSYLITSITNTPDFGNKIALKGGTALRKLYYPRYRFSEDLDYSTIQLGPLPDCTNLMALAVIKMKQLLLQNGPFDLQFEVLNLPEPHPGKQSAYYVRVQFPYHRQLLCRLKVEITSDETILLPITKRQIIHDYDEILNENVNTYNIQEIVVEKLRTILQVRKKYTERGWIAGRICRDYYDIWRILSKEGHFNGQIPEILSQKCQIRQVNFTDPSDFTPDFLLEQARRQWKQLLLPFVPNAPQADVVLIEVQDLINALWI